ncbi:MAG: hypothetical protein RRY02_09740 [Muribaculaceae bacterium]
MLYNLSNPLDVENYKLRCDRLLSTKAVVDLTEKKRKRSSSQNKYLHVILSYFATQYGESLEYVKQKYFKIHCNPDIFIRDKVDAFIGKTKILRSSADLDTLEMTTAIDRFRNWSAKEADIYLPAPDEDVMIQLMEIETDRNKHYL